MKSTEVGADGTVRCPKCGGTSFSMKRTAKAKALGVATVGVGAVMMPKHVYCLGCGSHLKAHGGDREQAPAPASEWRKVPVADVRVGDVVKQAGGATVEAIETGRLGFAFRLDSGRTFRGIKGATVDVRRP